MKDIFTAMAYPLDVAQDNNLTFAAKGMMAYICLENYHTRINLKDPDLFVDRIHLACGCIEGRNAYRELVDAGYINDFLKEGLEE